MSLEAEIAHLLSQASDVSDDDVADVAAVLILLEGAQTPDPAGVAIVKAFAGRAGLFGLLPDEVPARIAAYFENRRSTSLAVRIGQLLRAELAQGSEALRRSAAALQFRTETKSVARHDEERPAGTVPGGPALRFAVERLIGEKK